MNADQTGGTAYPIPAFFPPVQDDHEDNVRGIEEYATYPEEGMTILDRFAASALEGYLAAHAGEGVYMPEEKKTARDCYKYAAAMIAERRRLYDEPPLCQCPGEGQVGEVPPIPALEVPPIPPPEQGPGWNTDLTGKW